MQQLAPELMDSQERNQRKCASSIPGYEFRSRCTLLRICSFLLNTPLRTRLGLRLHRSIWGGPRRATARPGACSRVLRLPPETCANLNGNTGRLGETTIKPNVHAGPTAAKSIFINSGPDPQQASARMRAAPPPRSQAQLQRRGRPAVL